jgi:hypothetical protein
MAAKATDEFIPSSEIVTAPRGRKKDLNSNLLEILGKVTVDQGVALKGTFGEVTDPKDRSKVSATIRKHWREVYGEDDDSPKPKIDFHPTSGIPQVRMRG